MGSSMAENHPVGFQCMMEARERGAKVIHVDRGSREPRPSRTFGCHCAGSKIVFLGGLIHYVLDQGKEFREYVKRLQRSALGKLKWLVVRDMVEVEAATLWKDSPEVERSEVSPEEIGTEVFLFPAAGTARKAAHSRIHSVCCSFGARRSIRREIRAAKPGSWFTGGDD
jgi:anaerobic selenocysteine-containing dehydrogenase